MILFVDDDDKRMESIIDELSLSGLDVRFYSDVDEAVTFFETHSEEVKLLILDIMMPHGSNFNAEETELGLRTGVRFFKKIREARYDLPVIIFTNVSDQDVSERFGKENRCAFLQKRDFLPFEFAEEVRRVLASNRTLFG
ncbi:MAG TPA: response regulator [Thermoanaerobaculia bacterium]|jgi:CheY-like chemotaxis protein